MPTVDDINKQKQAAEQMKRDAEAARQEQKALLRKEIARMDKELTDLRARRNQAATEMSKLG